MPITHSDDRDGLSERLRAARLADVCIEDTDRHGWRVSGRRHEPVLSPVED
jgi:hypothetical protein